MWRFATYAEVEPRSEEGRGDAHAHDGGDVVSCDELGVQAARALPMTEEPIRTKSCMQHHWQHLLWDTHWFPPHRRNSR